MSKKQWSMYIMFAVLLVGGFVLLARTASDKRFNEQLGRGLRAIDKGDTKTAELETRKAIRLRPDSGEGHFVLGTIYLSLKKAGPARKELETAIELDPDSADNYYYLSFVHFNLLKQKEKAVTLMSKAIKIEPRDYQYRITQGVYLERLGRDSQAISQYEAAIRLAPKIPGLKKKLAALRAKVAAGR